MKFGVNTLLWTAAFDKEHVKLLPELKRNGFDGVEIARFSFDGFPAHDIRRALDSEGLACTFCSALTGDLSLVSAESAVRDRTLEFLKQGIETAAELGADLFVGPFCAPVGFLPGRRRQEDEWNRCVEALLRLTAALEDHRVTLAIEPLNRFETYFLNTVADAVALCRQVGHQRIGILYDTFHANIEEKDFGQSLKACGGFLKHVHACENDRGTPGSGHVDWGNIFPVLRELHYDGWLVIESFGSRIPEIARAACIWRDLAPSAEALAFQGLQFLRRTAQ